VHNNSGEQKTCDGVAES